MYHNHLVLVSIVSGRQPTRWRRHTPILQKGALWPRSQNAAKIETVMGELKFLLVSAVPPASSGIVSISLPETPVVRMGY